MKRKNLLFNLLLLVFMTHTISSGFAQTCPTGMISYWRLQEASGNVLNDEKGLHDAVAASSGPSQTAGISGKAQLFGGSAYASVPSHADYNWAVNASFSIELWVKYISVGSQTEVIIGRDDPATQTHWYVGKTNSGTIEFYTRASDGSSGSVESSSAYDNGLWHHVVAIRDGSQGKHYLYVDGTLQNAGGTTIPLTAGLASTGDITLGNMVYNDLPDFYYNGAIDEAAIYNVALNSTLITEHYNNVRLYQIGYCSGNSPVLFSSPNVYATVGQQYTYDVDASGNPVPTYTLLEKPTGMTIDATGLITWTPASVSENGHVVVKAENSLGSVQQSFNVFVSTPPVCRDNLIAYWDFNETGSAPFYDKIANYKLTGNAGHTSGRAGTGIAFNGASDSLSMKDHLEDPTRIFFDFDDVPSFSIEVWMKSSATPSGTMVLVGRDEDENDSHYWIGVNADGTPEFYLRDWPVGSSTTVSVKGSTSVLDGAWHHIVGTFNHSTNDIRLYIDKALVDEANVDMSIFGGNNSLNVGHLNMDPNFFWYEGALDELAFYNTPLTVERITNNYNNAVAGKGACTYNYAPVIVSTPVTTVNQGSLYSYKIIATDAKENDITGISAVTLPAWLTLTYVASDTFATISGTPGNANVGANSVKLRVTDGSINVDQTFTIQVANVNDPPVFTSTAVTTVNEDATYTYTATATDVDAGTVLTYSAPTKPAWLSFDAGTHILSGVPTNDEVGVFDVTLRVTDGTASVDQVFQVTVNNVNDLPVVTTTAPLEVHANLVYMYEIKATDVDAGDVLTYSCDSKPAWLTFTAGTNGGILTGTPAQANMGTHAIILKVNDGHADVMQGYTLTVLAPSAIIEIDNSMVKSAYPNPASDKVFFDLAKAGKVKIEMFDLSGNLLKTVHYTGDKAEVEVSDLSSGLYIYKLHQDNKLSIGKITKN